MQLLRRIIHTNKRNLPMSLGVFALLIFVGSVLYYLTISGNRIVHPPQPTSFQPVISGWKTYTNSEFGFRIHYPQDLYSAQTETLTGRDAFYGNVYLSLEPNDKFNNAQPLSVTYAVSVAAVNNLNNYSLSNPRQLFGNGPLINYVPEMLGETPISETLLGGQKAFRVDGCCGGQFGIESDIQTIRANKLYQIVVAPRQVSGDEHVNKSTYEKILSSFEFIDS